MSGVDLAELAAGPGDGRAGGRVSRRSAAVSATRARRCSRQQRLDGGTAERRARGPACAPPDRRVAVGAWPWPGPRGRRRAPGGRRFRRRRGGLVLAGRSRPGRRGRAGPAPDAARPRGQYRQPTRAGAGDRLARPRAAGRDLDGDRRGVLVACRRGLETLDEHRATPRAARSCALWQPDTATSWRRLALRHAVAQRHPRAAGLERAVARDSAVPAAGPPTGRRRARSGRWRPCETPDGDSADARAEGSPTAPTAGRGAGPARAARSGDVPTTSRGTSGSDDPVRGRAAGGLTSTAPPSSSSSTSTVCCTRLSPGSGRVTHAGRGPRRRRRSRRSTFARFALRQTARGRPSDLDDVGRRLQEALLGDAVRRLGDGPVVVSSTRPAARHPVGAACRR